MNILINTDTLQTLSHRSNNNNKYTHVSTCLTQSNSVITPPPLKKSVTGRFRRRRGNPKLPQNFHVIIRKNRLNNRLGHSLWLLKNHIYTIIYIQHLCRCSLRSCRASYSNYHFDTKTIRWISDLFRENKPYNYICWAMYKYTSNNSWRILHRTVYIYLDIVTIKVYITAYRSITPVESRGGISFDVSHLFYDIIAFAPTFVWCE